MQTKVFWLSDTSLISVEVCGCVYVFVCVCLCLRREPHYPLAWPKLQWPQQLLLYYFLLFCSFFFCLASFVRNLLQPTPHCALRCYHLMCGQLIVRLTPWCATTPPTPLPSPLSNNFALQFYQLVNFFEKCWKIKILSFRATSMPTPTSTPRHSPTLLISWQLWELCEMSLSKWRISLLKLLCFAEHFVSFAGINKRQREGWGGSCLFPISISFFALLSRQMTFNFRDIKWECIRAKLRPRVFPCLGVVL